MYAQIAISLAALVALTLVTWSWGSKRGPISALFMCYVAPLHHRHRCKENLTLSLTYVLYIPEESILLFLTFTVGCFLYFTYKSIIFIIHSIDNIVALYKTQYIHVFTVSCSILWYFYVQFIMTLAIYAVMVILMNANKYTGDMLNENSHLKFITLN